MSLVKIVVSRWGMLLCCLGLLSTAAVADNEKTVKTVKVTDSIYVLMAGGGNVGLLVGDDGAFVIDDDYAPMADELKAAIAKVTDKPVAFLVNTHWHGDHTGGNTAMGSSGAIIVAHENVRARLKSGGEIKAFKMVTPPAPAAALPVITFADEIRFHWNGQALDVKHVAPAHTDGDAVIYFTDSNVLHTGDVFFNGIYPFIDADSGGSARGVIAAVDQLLAMIDGQTKIIPGHGPVASRQDLVAYREMLNTNVEAIAALKAKGMTVDEVVAAKPTASYDAKWGGFLEPDMWVKIVYQAL